MRNNGKIWRLLAIIMTIFFAVIGVVYGYGRFNGRFEAVEQQIKKVNDNEKAIVGLQRDIEYIKKAVDRIEKKL